ncbi:MAG: amidase [Thermoanaerobaculia bacterium]|nr:amidase [Thermoanaerobaculia bacterium]MBP9823419.1 amidase [Thermoanaerobaculia bacterium]
MNVVEASIPEMQEAMSSGSVTSRELVTQHLLRIAFYEDRINATIAVNPRALDEADALDRERRAGKVRGPLHGIPIALKDNIHTIDMPTTGGALAFAGFVPPYEATLVSNLRAAGAIVLAKTQMTELANWVAGPPGMPTNYNSLNGYGFNPYDPRRDPREPTFDGRPALATGGSSSGTGTAASFWVANVGTETSGSILSPANANRLAAVKPTVGRISRHGIIPITADQDTAGPIARSVTDAAILLGALEGAQADPNDPSTSRCARETDYTKYLDRGALRGARIGIPRAYFYDAAKAPGNAEPQGGLDAPHAAAMEEAIAILRREGAIVVDPADIPSVVDADPERNFLLWNICRSLDEAKTKRCSIDFAYGMERDFNLWLASLGPAAPVKSLTELRQWNREHQKAGTLKYGQALLDFSDAMDPHVYRERYEADRAKDLALTATHGIDEAMTTHRLDALLFPGPRGANLAARPGYPTVMVPFGTVATIPDPPFPDGFDPAPLALGVSFTGSACAEPRLLALGYAFEQATRKRLPPNGMP